MKPEYGVFRKGGDHHDAPMGGFTFPDYARAASYMQQHIDWADWLEVRTREVTKWRVSA